MNRSRAMPDDRVLLCLGPCHGEFYLPLHNGEEPACPNNRTHPVAIYTLAMTHTPPVEDDE